VALIGERLVDLEVIAPAGELEAVEAPGAALRRKVLDGQVGPLAGEERDGAGHRASLMRGLDSVSNEARTARAVRRGHRADAQAGAAADVRVRRPHRSARRSGARRA